MDLCEAVSQTMICKAVVHTLFGTKDQFHGRQFFSRLGQWWGVHGMGWTWFGDDLSALHLLCTLFLFCGNLRIFCLDFRVRVLTSMRI